jgi:hypothetical protein
MQLLKIISKYNYMTKIIVKKNNKPQKKQKQKQKQTQKQNVTVNIGTNIIKKRGRPKRAQTVKQPTKQTQPIVSPSFLVAAIKASIFSATTGSGQRTILLSINEKSNS